MNLSTEQCTLKVESAFQEIKTILEIAEESPMKILTMVRSLEPQLSDLIGMILKEALREIEAYGDEKPVINGYKMETYQRSVWKYPDWDEYREAKQRVKELENLMQQSFKSSTNPNLSKRVALVTADGEEVPAAEQNYSSPTIKLTKSK